MRRPRPNVPPHRKSSWFLKVRGRDVDFVVSGPSGELSSRLAPAPGLAQNDRVRGGGAAPWGKGGMARAALTAILGKS
jgi:hypothetical protein